jgi:hypothetical protein
MEAHNFRFLLFQSLEFLSVRVITAENVVNALIEMIFHHTLIGVAFRFCPSHVLPEALFDASFPPGWYYWVILFVVSPSFKFLA